MTATPAAHRWRFFRSGGFDQVRLETVDDLRHLAQLDLKLWASLACPATGLEMDPRMLAYVDADEDGRIRAPEIIGAVRWALERLARPEVLFQPPGLPLDAIDAGTETGERLLRSAKVILHNLGQAEATQLTIADTAERARLFPKGEPNGDGIVPASFTDDEALQALIGDIIAGYGGEADRGGETGVSAAAINRFFDDAEALQAWRARAEAEAEALMPLGEATAAAVAAYQAVAAKIEDWFMRVRFAGYDGRAATLMNGSEADLTQLALQALNPDNEEARRMPLARIGDKEALPLQDGLNPAWSDAMLAFRQQVVLPLLGERDSLDAEGWREIKARLAAHLDWLAARPELPVAAVDEARLKDALAQGRREALLALVERDEAVAEEAASILDVDRLVRYQQYLLRLLDNFVSLRCFYAERDAIFQAGRLYLDGRSFDLCLRVADAGRHAALAELSRTYLAYCDCVSKRGGAKMTIVAAVTAGGAGNLMVGRNGIFYDRDGNDWDATITKIVSNPISLRDAFWSPYRRIGKMVSEQFQKLAASREAAVDQQAAATVAAPTAQGVASAFDISKFVGVLAAVGLAVGAIGSAFALLLASLLGMPWWKLPLVVLAVVLLISGPSMVLAWFKLRARNLAPILDANGWAVNTQAKINIPFGTALSRLAELPEGARRSLHDPYVPRRRWPWWVALFAALIAGCGYVAWEKGWVGARHAPVAEAAAPLEAPPAE